MQRMYAVALAAAVLIPPGQVMADGAGSHAYKAQIAGENDATDMLYVVTTGRASSAPRFSGRISHSPLRPVVIDGAPLQIDEVSLRARIREGSYAVVYPGPMVRWVVADDGTPNYPPDWY